MFYEVINFNHYYLETVAGDSSNSVDGETQINEQGHAIELQGSIRQLIHGNFTITPDTLLMLEIKIEGHPETAALGFTNGSTFTVEDVVTLSGELPGSHAFAQIESQPVWKKVTIPVGQLFSSGEDLSLVVVAQSSANNNDAVKLRHIALID